MNPVDQHIGKIRALCDQHKVARLFVFGSVLRENTFTSNSDIDLLVDFSNIGLNEYADNYFDLKQQLEKILNRSVDLLEEKAIRNPYLRKEIEKDRKLIYG
ncbi:MAG: nucleotidyltransferase family protein [Bacteroidia bacterium]|jgi:hypothetical protein